MDTRLLFQDAAGFATPMLAVFAVDISIDQDGEPLPALLTTSDAVTNAAAKVLESGEFKATLVEINERAKALVLGKQGRAGYGDKDGRLKLGDLAYPSPEGPARLDELRKIHSLLKL